MSVLARLRGPSQLEVEKLAEEIRAEGTRLAWNTNLIPKKWRDNFSKPLCSLLHGLYCKVVRTNKIRTTTEELVVKRKKEAQEAIDILEEIYELINYIATTLPVDWNKFNTILTLMEKERKKLENWRDSTKLI